MSEFLSVYITTATREEAKHIAQAVVEEGLAACANIGSEIESIYRWQGKVEHAQETALLLKITADKFNLVRERVRQLHSYQRPCIVAWPIVAGDEAYLQWIKTA